MGGIEAIRFINAIPGPAILVVTMHHDDESLFAAIRAGAAGYLLKGTGQDELVRALLAVADGEAVFGHGVARRVLEHFSTTRIDKAIPLPELSDREREVLDLVAQGHGNQAIAQRLRLSPKTVRNNLPAIIGKLQARDRADAAAQGRAAGLGIPPD